MRTTDKPFAANVRAINTNGSVSCTHGRFGNTIGRSSTMTIKPSNQRIRVSYRCGRSYGAKVRSINRIVRVSYRRAGPIGAHERSSSRRFGSINLRLQASSRIANATPGAARPNSPTADLACPSVEAVASGKKQK